MLTVFDKKLLEDYEEYKKQNKDIENEFSLDTCFRKQREFYKNKEESKR